MKSSTVYDSFIVFVPVLKYIIVVFMGILVPSLSLAAKLEEVIVTSDFRDSALLEFSNSVTVLSSKDIARRQAKHLDQILNLAPNVNFASGASRGRFVQIRGIGERSQFIEPINPSVGIAIDGIDFTGIAGAATTMDIKQVEILRGPQGTLFGANALAGLINLESYQPSEDMEGTVTLTSGSYDSNTFFTALGGPISQKVGSRLAVQSHKSDGYITNDYLRRDDTDGIDELSFRSTTEWAISNDLKTKLTIFHVDVDNGYDGFSLDNTRTTLSDNPGHDRQKSTALGVEITRDLNKNFKFTGMASRVQSDLEYGYDEDWAYPSICVGLECDGWEYNSQDNYLRDRENSTIDLRFISNRPALVMDLPVAWVFGVYSRQQSETLIREYTYNSSDFSSTFDTRNSAVYGQLSLDVSSRLNLLTGIRFENRDATYVDTDAVMHNVDEDLWGGRISLQYKTDEGRVVYGLISRGYKAGGVNSDPDLAPEDREFDTEFMWNIETGFKASWMQDKFSTQIALFYQERRDIQIKQSLVQPRVDSNASDFIDYLGNSAKGSNYGLELEFVWSASDLVTLSGSLGRLQTKYNTPSSDYLNSREQAHAPSYQFDVGVGVRITDNWVWTLDLEGKDDFYLSSSHNTQSQAYQLVNTNLTYDNGTWTAAFWARNIFDEEIIIRGFRFGNDPRKYYATESYFQYGEPRVVGLSGGYRFF